jgi:hypothetical protein
MRPSRLAILESSGADSSGLTEAMRKISGGIDVRLSEQQVVMWALYSACAFYQRETVPQGVVS